MTPQPVMDAVELQDYLDEIFPQQRGRIAVEAVGSMSARVRALVVYQDLRPGGTVSGPTLFTVADCAFYVALMGMIGRQALAVTTNLNINFMRKPPVADIIGAARILKLGKTLATGDVTLWSEGVDAPVAHAAVTYAIPPKA